MDILLTHGYYLYEDPHELKVMKPYPTLGLLYISSHLKSKGFEVDLFDTTFSNREAWKAYLVQHRPTIVGIYTNLMTKLNVLPMIQDCKALGATVVVGGPEPPHYADEFLDAGADVVVIGEGELTLEALIPEITARGPHRLHDIHGVAFRDEAAKTIRTGSRPLIKNLDAQPFPDRGAIDTERYLRTWKEHHGRSSISLITARGCPYTCRWCSHTVFGNTHRRRSPENVLAELELIIDRYAPDQLWYADDVLTIHRGWILKFAALLQQRGIKIPFECISRADRLDGDVIEALTAMGCFRLWIGAESGSQQVLDAMDRKTRIEDVQRKTHMLKNAGIETGMFIMMGYEGEEIEDIEATVDHLKKSEPDLFLTTVAYPIKGTSYYNEVESRVVEAMPWHQRTDRDLTVAGRHSKRFYSFATRWMVNEIGLHKMLKSRPRDVRRIARAFVNSRVGRIGMALSKGEKERAPAGRGQLHTENISGS
ncbi:MAG: B12-binding domain-containing radical SAM protein [Chloroflexota bacterium]|nr:B12-binding domain-containing radical SAM protein [Chloroflexota bacterium]